MPVGAQMGRVFVRRLSEEQITHRFTFGWRHSCHKGKALDTIVALEGGDNSARVRVRDKEDRPLAGSL